MPHQRQYHVRPPALGTATGAPAMGGTTVASDGGMAGGIGATGAAGLGCGACGPRASTVGSSGMGTPVRSNRPEGAAALGGSSAMVASGGRSRSSADAA
jgi:hypothetical protein